jgi:DNA-binding transcriptional LysR family regulator
MTNDHVSLIADQTDETILNNERGVQHNDTPAFIEKLDRVALDDVAFFQKLMRAKSIRRGAVKLGMSINTVRNKIKKIEDVLGEPIVIRSKTGLITTQAGDTILAMANDLVSVQSQHIAGKNKSKRTLAQVSLCVSEGIGTFWILPRLHNLAKRLGKTKVALNSLTGPADDMLNNEHIRISFKRPDDLDNLVFKLATIHVQLWTSQKYIEKFGMLEDMDDLSRHKYIHQDTPGLRYDMAQHFLAKDDFEKALLFKVNSSTSLFWSVYLGLGMGILPTYAGLVQPGLVPVTVSPSLQFELWLSYSPALKNISTIRDTIAWLREIFDAKKYPCFAARYHRPETFSDIEMLDIDNI